MKFDDLPPERKEILYQLSRLTQDDLNGLVKLIERHPELLSIVKKDEAFGIVGAWLKNGAIWFTIIAGAYFMGVEKLTIFLKGLIGS